MLMISRRIGERIVIGEDIEIVITEIHRSSVKIGVSGPRGKQVLRGEVRDAIEEANRAAAASALDAVEAFVKVEGPMIRRSPDKALAVTARASHDVPKTDDVVQGTGKPGPDEKDR